MLLCKADSKDWSLLTSKSLKQIKQMKSNNNRKGKYLLTFMAIQTKSKKLFKSFDKVCD